MTPAPSGRSRRDRRAGRGAPPRAPVAMAAGPPPHAWRLAAIAVALAVLVFFYPLVLGRVFVSPDSVAPAGFSKIALDALQHRHVYALWNPYHFLGMPTFGSLAFVPNVYPLDPIFGFLNGTLHFPDLTWLLAHYLLLGLSMLLLLRAFGAGPLPSAIGAIAFALTPNLVAVGAFGHGSQMMTAAYLPLLLFLLDRFIRRGSVLALAGFAFAAALQLLRGHVQVVFYSWLALGGYALFQAVAAAREGRRATAVRAVVGLAAGLALGFGMSAFLYLPTHEYAKLSIRSAGEGGGTGFEYATSWSFAPREMLTFVIPGMFGFGGGTYWGGMPFTDYPNYMGILPLALALYGAWRVRGTVRWYLIALAVVALLVSFGKYFSPLYALLYRYLPYFNKFRVPVMILVLVQFATAALAALGLDAALEGRGDAGGAGRRPVPDAWMRAALLSLAGGVALFVLLSALAPSLEQTAIAERLHRVDPGAAVATAREAVGMASVDAFKSGLFLAAGLALVALYRRGRIAWTAAAAGLLLVTAADLWIPDRRIMDPQVGSAGEYQGNFEETPEITFLRSDPTLFRVLPLRWNDSRLAAFGIPSVLGYHPAKPRLYQAFMDTVGMQNLAVARMLNVKYVLTDGYVPAGTEGMILRHDGPVKVYEVAGTLPRAQVVHRLREVRDDGVALAVMRTGGYRPGEEALWEEPGDAPLLREPPVPDSVRVLKYDFNECAFLAETAAPGLFVLRDQWDPDWIATVDGKREPVHRVDFLMRGVLLDAGVHRVEFRYEPAALATGIRISIASLAAALLLAAAGLWGALRRAPPRAAPKPADGAA